MGACKEQKGPGNVRRYDVMVLEPTSRELSSSYPATIRGKQDIDIRPKVSGYITDIYVREGAVVTKGQPMFVIDKVSYEAALENAIAQYNAARSKKELRIQQIEALETAEESTRELMRHSEATYLEVLTAQQSLLNARLLQATDRFEEITAIIALYKALGGR